MAHFVLYDLPRSKKKVKVVVIDKKMKEDFHLFFCSASNDNRT